MAKYLDILEARHAVKSRFGFYTHFTIYICVNFLLFLINFFSFNGIWWFIWPLLGWGIGVVIQWIFTFFPFSDWAEKGKK